jgi:hypothetical protein
MNIDYPKMHLLVHLTLRYRLHGASRITSTRIGEVLHKMDHWFYRKTNKRNVMPQVSFLAFDLIRSSHLHQQSTAHTTTCS